MDTSILMDEDDGFDATEAFMDRLADKGRDKPSKVAAEKEDPEPEEAEDDQEELDEEPAEDDSEDPDEDSGEDEADEPSEDDGDEDEEEEPKKKAKTREISDDDKVKVKVDGKEIDFAIKDLKRLAGQEASLTRKSQETAELRKQVESQAVKYVSGLETMLNNAKERFKPFENINFLALSKNPDISAEELTMLQNEAQRAWNDVNYLSTELDNTIKAVETERRNNLIKQAAETIQLLKDPEKGIPGWDNKLYDDIRGFAINNGLDATLVNELVDPAAIKLLYKAMMFDKGSKALKGTKKVDKTPKKILKGVPEVVSNKVKTKSKNDAFTRLRRSGSAEDAQDAFLARLGDD